MIDTGNMKSVIQRSLFNKKVIRPLESAPLLETATGGDAKVKIYLGQSEIKANVLVVDITDEFILGFDIMT